MMATTQSNLSRFASPQIKSASRMFGYCLILDTPESWWGLVPVLAARLSLSQRASLAFMALKSVDENAATMIVEAALQFSRGAGAPIPPFHNHMDEAAFWADMAEPDEIEAYCLATFNAMPPARQCAFLDFAQGRVAA